MSSISSESSPMSSPFRFSSASSDLSSLVDFAYSEPENEFVSVYHAESIEKGMALGKERLIARDFVEAEESFRYALSHEGGDGAQKDQAQVLEVKGLLAEVCMQQGKDDEAQVTTPFTLSH